MRFFFVFLAGIACAQAEVSEVRLSKQYRLPHLPFMVMEHFQILQKQAEKQGLQLNVSWTTLSNATAMMDAILSGGTRGIQCLEQGQPAQGRGIYIAMAGEKRATLDEIEKMVTDPDVDYTTTSINVMKFVEFMNLAGTVKKKPGSWKDLFFPIAYEKPGS